MPISSLSPNSGAPGAALAITGTSLPDDAMVIFTAGGRTITVAPYLISPTLVRVTVPAFDGLAQTATVAVLDGDTATNSLSFTLAAVPAVESPYPLCSLGTLKTLLGLTASDTTDDAKLEAMVLAASARIAGERGVQFRLVDYEDELRDGDGSPMLLLGHTPIVSVDGLEIGGQAVDASEVKVYPHYIRFEESDGTWNPRLRGGNRVFPRGSQNVKVTYTAGYAEVPAEIVNACVLQVVYIQNTLAKQGVISETNSVAAAATQYAQVGLAPAAVRAVNRYRRPRTAVV